MCYQHQQARHTATDSVCEGRNIALHLPSFEGSAMTGFVEATWMRMNGGALQAACSPTGPFSKDKFPLCLSDWFVSAFKQVPDVACDEWIEDSVYLITRNNNLNPYHCSEDWVFAYLVWAILKLQPSTTRVMFMDLMLPGPYNEFWNSVMTDGKLMPPFHQWRDSKIAEGKKTICLRHAIFNPPGSGSPVTKDKSFDSKCRDNAVVQAFGAYTLLKMGVVVPVRLPKQPLAATFISRKDYKFNTNMNMQRKIDNEAEVANAVQAALGSAVVVSRVDFAEKSWKEQLETDVSTDILIGVHGAGMTQLLFLPKHAAVIEMFTPGTSANHHYHNLANWAGKLYFRLDVEVHVNAAAVAELVAKAAAEVRQRLDARV